jgi:hypothetical protein
MATINEESARRALEMNSFRDYEPGSATDEFNQLVANAQAIADQQKKRVDPMYHEKIDSLLATYIRKLADNMNAGFAIEARCPSVMISGPANFSTRKKEQQNAARDRNYQERQEIDGLLDKIRSVGTGGISSDDPDAREKLASKIAKLQALQETMKAVNAYYKKNNTLENCPDLTPEQAAKLTASMADGWRQNPRPFESFQLSNNNANIRRLQQRLDGMKRLEENPLDGWDFDGGRVEANADDNRLQVFFDEKPDEEKRDAMKRNGFRWAPSVGAWQRQLTRNAVYAAKHYISFLKPKAL